MIPWRLLFGLASPSGKNGRLSVFIFHRVLAKPDPLLTNDPDANEFERIVTWISAWFNVLPLDQAVKHLKTNDLPPRAAAITFDDGYFDNYAIALPILKAHGLSATFFIATGHLNGGCMWNDAITESIRQYPMPELDLSSLQLGVYNLGSPSAVRHTILTVLGKVKYRDPKERLEIAQEIAANTGIPVPTGLMMTTDQVIAMREQGMLIGAHTVSHPILARLSDAEVTAEIGDSKDFLESILGERISLFAYPNGKPDCDYRSSDAAIVRNLGFEAAMTTAWGVADHQSDPMQLPRFTPWDKDCFRFGMRLMQNLLLNFERRNHHLAK